MRPKNSVFSDYLCSGTDNQNEVIPCPLNSQPQAEGTRVLKTVCIYKTVTSGILGELWKKIWETNWKFFQSLIEGLNADLVSLELDGLVCSPGITLPTQLCTLSKARIYGQLSNVWWRIMVIWTSRTVIVIFFWLFMQETAVANMDSCTYLPTFLRAQLVGGWQKRRAAINRRKCSVQVNILM